MDFKKIVASLTVISAFASSGCFNENVPQAPGPNLPGGNIDISGCTTASIPGTSWQPNISTISPSNHNSNISVQKTVVAATAPLSGLTDAVDGREVTVNFTVPSDLGLNGSVTLLAQVSNYPTGIDPTSYPVLTYLSDGTNEYINLPRNASGHVSCGGGGFYNCSASSCLPNPPCQTVGYPSAFSVFDKYWQHQIADFGYESVNTFPTCRWSDGNSTTYDPSTVDCAFNSYLASTGGHLPVGTYTAKYFLLTDNYGSIPAGNNATLTVTVVQKKDVGDTTVNGAVDVNVILVGSQNISDSHTVAGQRNLNTLFYAYAQYLSAANIKVGTVNAYELNCTQGGDALASISSNQLGGLVQAGSAALTGSTEGKALNLFMISEFSDDTGILGISEGIGGPPVNGLQSSGLAIATYNSLGIFNPSCTTTPCPPNTQDADFYEMGNTIAHETGHFLGLNHPSEGYVPLVGSGDPPQPHDPVYDTPMCTAADPATNGYITMNSCLVSDTNVFGPTGKKCSDTCIGYNPAAGSFCPNARECAFNYMMWYTSKNYDPATGAADGNQYSPDSSIIMGFSSYVQ